MGIKVGQNRKDLKIEAIKLSQKFDAFYEYWSPKIIGELNGQQVKVAKLKGEFVMHQHDNEDELFLVIEGKLLMEIPGRTLEIHAGEFVIIPKGTPHKPIAPEEVKVLLFEPKLTLNTGELENEMTLKNPDWI